MKERQARTVVVATTPNVMIATIWKDLLTAEGIEAQVVGANVGASVYAGTPGLALVSILVWDQDCARAREILDAAERGDEAL
jgi:Putative prokaryotic signal transducing protein